VHRVPIRCCPCALSPPLGPPLALRHRLTGLPYPTSPTYPTDWRPPTGQKGGYTPPHCPPFGAPYPHRLEGQRVGDWPPMAKRVGVA
jgi:hypothetical protein